MGKDWRSCLPLSGIFTRNLTVTWLVNGSLAASWLLRRTMLIPFKGEVRACVDSRRALCLLEHRLLLYKHDRTNHIRTFCRWRIICRCYMLISLLCKVFINSNLLCLRQPDTPISGAGILWALLVKIESVQTLRKDCRNPM